MMQLRQFETTLRENLRKQLQGPGITWNLPGIMSAFDRAVIATLHAVIEPKEKGAS